MRKNNRRNFLKFAFSVGAGTLLTSQGSSTEAANMLGGKSGETSTFSAFPHKAEGVSERVEGGITLIARDGRSLELNAVGTFLWHHIDGSRSVHHLAQLVADTYQIDFTNSYHDSAIFVTALVKKSFLTLPRSGPCFQFPS